MKVWVQRRLSGGEVLAQPECMGDQFEPLELLVQNVTDQGRRPLTKVARLFQLGQRRPIDELLAPKMYWLQKAQFVLTGAEQVRCEYDKIKCTGQSWLCTLALNVFNDAFKVVHTFRYGEKLSRRELADASASSGVLSVSSSMDPMLGRATVRADLVPGGAQPSYGRANLLDADLEWMGAEGFELSGFEQVQVNGGASSVRLQQGWLCKLDIARMELPTPVRSSRAPRIER